ncbi:unnamed protein product [Camellia sinensis]
MIEGGEVNPTQCEALTMVCGEFHTNITRFTLPIRVLAFNKFGSMLAATGDDEGIKLINTIDGSIARVLKGHKGSVTGLAFDPKSKYLGSLGSVDGEEAFQPGSTPMQPGNRCFLCYNMVGSITTIEHDGYSHIEIDFHNTRRGPRVLSMTDYFGFTMAALNENGSVFANPCKGEKGMSTLMYRPFSSWANNSEGCRLDRLAGKVLKSSRSRYIIVVVVTATRYGRFYRMWSKKSEEAMQNMKKNKSNNNEDAPKQKERHIVSWSQE